MRATPHHNTRNLPVIATPWGLTPLELECLRLRADGKDRPLIAQILGMSPYTVDTHSFRAKSKMNAETLYHAVVLLDRFLRSQPAASAM